MSVNDGHKSQAATGGEPAGVNKPRITGKFLEPYDPSMPFNYYEDLMKNMFKLNGITTEDEQKTYIFGSIGMKSYMELRNALSGQDLNALAVDDIWAALRDRYTPRKLIVAERDHFLALKQKTGQTLSDFSSELLTAATRCDFEKITDAKKAREMMMVQAFVRGLKSEQTRIRILQTEELDFKKALELANIYEQADSEGHNMGQGRGDPGIHRMSRPQAKTGYRSASRSRRPSQRGQHRQGEARQGNACTRCGRQGHEPSQCYFRDRQCHRCGAIGHTERVCSSSSTGSHGSTRSNSGKRNTGQRMNHMPYEPYDSATTTDLNKMSMYTMRQCNIDHIGSEFERARFITISVNNHPVKFELDTGAGTSVITAEEWETLGKPELETIKGKMPTDYHGKPVDALGILHANVEFEGRKAITPIFVVRGKQALCGRTCIRDLKLNCGPHYDNGLYLVDKPMTLAEVLKANSEVFDTSNACCKKEVSLAFKNDAKPKFV